MSGKGPSKDEALEALDFIVSVLKEHEKDLDRLISELGTVTEKMGATGEFNGRLEKVEQRLNGLQSEITNLITYLSGSHGAQTFPASQPVNVSAPQRQETSTFRELHGPPVIVRCKQWEDFSSVASGAQTVSFMYRDSDKTFQVDAVKDDQIVTYSGDVPKPNLLLRSWLSRQLGVPERKAVEGVLAIG
jgi:hypothetical protein